MFSPAWQRFDNASRMALPFMTALLCCLLSVMAWPLPFLGTVTPPLALMAVYYWMVHRPDLFGAGSAFAIGLVNDVVNDLPMGLSALLFVAVCQVILGRRRYFMGHSFSMLWIGFMFCAVITLVAATLCLSLVRWQLVPIFPVLIQMVMAIVFFPLPCWIFIRLQRAALPQS